jgi:anti-anti-sigma factor
MFAAHLFPYDLPQFRIRLEREEACVVVAAEGDLDITTVDRLRREVLDLGARGCPRIVLDLSGLTFADSSQIHLLLELQAASAVDGFAFAVHLGDAGPARRLLAVARLEQRFAAA